MRVSKGLIISDTHLSLEDGEHPTYRLVKQFAKDWKPDRVFHLGDFGDWGVISHHNKTALRKIEGKRIKKEYEVLNRDLDELQEICGEINLYEGNHDNWVEQYIDEHPELEGLLEYPTALRLSERGVHFYPEVDQPRRIGKLWFLHGWLARKHVAMGHLEAIRGNCVFGHVHKFQSYDIVRFATGEEITAQAIGCLCSRQPDYARGRPTGFQNGFALVYINEDNGEFGLYPVRIVNGNFMVEGLVYSLSEIEKNIVRMERNDHRISW